MAPDGGSGQEPTAEEVRELIARVAALEREVGMMRASLWPSAAPAAARVAGSAPAPAPAPYPAQPYAQSPYAPPATGAPGYPTPGYGYGTPAYGYPPQRGSPGPGYGYPPYAGYGYPAPTTRPKPRPKAESAGTEAVLASTWFARIGALAVLIGAAFGFKYGMDQGFITRLDRVVIGLLAGLAFGTAGWWGHGKGWDRFAQAVTAGGIALGYLSIFVAHYSYGLISAPVALGSLFAITVANGALAYRYDSLALAALAGVGGFLNPILAYPGRHPGATTVLPYVAVVDAALAGLAFAKRWRPLDLLAVAGTWLLFTFGLATAGPELATPGLVLVEAFGTGFFLLLGALPFVAAAAAGRDPAGGTGPPSASASALPSAHEIGAAALVANVVGFFGISLAALHLAHHDAAFGVFTFLLAAATASMAALSGLLPDGDEAAVDLYQRILWGASAAAAAVAVALQFHGLAIADGWAVEGLALTVLAPYTRSAAVRVTGSAVLAAAALATFGELFSHYHPAHVLVSSQSGAVLVVIGLMAVQAALLARDGDALVRANSYPWTALAANALAVAWLSAEAVAHFHASAGGPQWQSLQFTLSATWAFYAGVLLLSGVAGRVRWARLGALALFGLTLAKMATVDLWTLTTGQRILAFIGMGGLLLACSLLYHRFKELILAPAEAVSAADPKPPSGPGGPGGPAAPGGSGSEGPPGSWTPPAPMMHR